MVKINEIELHSETCITYSNNIENQLNEEKNKKSFINENLNFPSHKSDFDDLNFLENSVKKNTNKNYCNKIKIFLYIINLLISYRIWK